MNALKTRLKQLEEDHIAHCLEMQKDEEGKDLDAVLSIYYGYYNQFLEFYTLDGEFISREHCNYNEFD